MSIFIVTILLFGYYLPSGQGIQVFEHVNENVTNPNLTTISIKVGQILSPILPVATVANVDLAKDDESTVKSLIDINKIVDDQNSNNSNNNNNKINESAIITTSTNVVEKKVKDSDTAAAAATSISSSSSSTTTTTESSNRQMSFIGNLNSRMPQQYPKLMSMMNEDQQQQQQQPKQYKNQHTNEMNKNSFRNNGNSEFKSSVPIMTSQQFSNYKKRQLFQKSQSHNNSSMGGNDQRENLNHQPSTKEFIPSPQLNEFFDSYQKPFMANNQFHPVHPVKSPATPYSHQWNSEQQVKYPDLQYLSKNYPKFEELSKQIQNQEKEKERTDQKKEQEKSQMQNWYYDPSQFHNFQTQTTTLQSQTAPTEKGKFVWIPDVEEPTTTPKEEFNWRPEMKNGTGKWQWVSTDENGSDVEPKIVSHGSVHPTYFEQIKIYQEMNSKPEHPYPFDFVGMGIESQTTQMTPFSFEGGETKDEKDKEQEKDTENQKNQMSLAEMLFPSKHNQNKGKEFGNLKNKSSPWKKVLHFLTAAIPIGLIISSLTPQIVYINTNDTGLPPSATFSAPSSPGNQQSFQQRSLDTLTDPGRKMPNPLMDFLNLLGEHSDNVERNTICEDRVFCEMATLGSNPDADVLNKMLWKIANDAPAIFKNQTSKNYIGFYLPNSIYVKDYSIKTGRICKGTPLQTHSFSMVDRTQTEILWFMSNGMIEKQIEVLNIITRFEVLQH